MVKVAPGQKVYSCLGLPLVTAPQGPCSSVELEELQAGRVFVFPLRSASEPEELQL